MKEEQKRKGLQSQLNTMTGELEALKIEVANKQREIQMKLKAIESLKAEIEKMASVTDFRVSEHAIVRYFERVKGYSLDEIEREILSDEVIRMANILGDSGKFPNGDYHVVMRNKTVTTII